MRVIAGKFKGRILKMPKGAEIRPTADKVKEALFNILGPQIQGSSFLELFAGCGNIGIEAKSRGAKQVFFVENNPACIRAIEANLRQLGVSFTCGLRGRQLAQVRILPLEAEKAIKLLGQRRKKFDFIFLDPPYGQDALKNCLIKICLCDILNPRSYVVSEIRRSRNLPQQLQGFKLMLSRNYGDTSLYFYQKEEGK